MCGIIGVIGIKSYNIIINSLKNLQNRGYDSAGICLYNKNFSIKKFVSDNISAVDKFNNIDFDAECGLGHTRWATHGKINIENCHPHISNDETICIIHNGIIENYESIKNFLLEKNYTFYSDTDTEVIANLISYYRKNNTMINTLEKIKNDMIGTWGLVILEKGSNRMYFIRKGSPLLVGINYKKKYALITSESSGFSGLVDEYFSVKENDICYLVKKEEIYFFSKDSLYSKSYKNMSFEDINEYSSKYYDIKIKNTDNKINKLEKYNYWILKEIEEQKDSSFNTIKNIHLKDIDKNIDNIIFLGCGTSFNAGLYASNYFKKCGFNCVLTIDGADFSCNDIPKIGKTCCIFLSQSGETLDLIRCIKICNENNIFKIGVINVVNSYIARETDLCFYLNAGKEVSVASTKSFTSQIIVLMFLYSQFYKIKKETIKYLEDDLVILYTHINKVINKSRESMKLWANKLVNKNNMFILGKDECYSIAREASLKIKEISYIHAESYPASSLKHGPFGLLEEGFPVILIDIGEKNRLKMMNVYNEIKCRSADIYTISDKKYIDRDNFFYIDNNSLLNSLLSIIPLQYLSFYLSIGKNINPDFPRNLAKVVTVE